MPSTIRFEFLHDLLAPSSTQGGHHSAAVAWLANTDPAALPLDTSADIFRNRYACVVLYYSTNGDGWRNKANWFSNTSVCSWYGVHSCSSTGIATSLRLRKLLDHKVVSIAALAGFVIMTLAKTSLEASQFASSLAHAHLVLDFNKLNGPIPSQIGLLTGLTDLLLCKSIEQFESIAVFSGFVIMSLRKLT
jgi:hypothetical protein